MDPSDRRLVVLFAVLVVVLACMALSVYSGGSLRRAFGDDPPRPLVLVVGSGLAGLTAAVSLAQQATVVVAEQALHVGGNSVRAKSGMARPTEDTEARRAAMLRDLLASARTADGGGGDPERARRLVDEAAAAHSWVREVLHVQLPVASRTGGHGEARTYRTRDGPVGRALVDAALSVATSRGVRVCLGRALTDIQRDESGAFVARFGDRAVQRCDAIVIATGGYAHPNSGLLDRELQGLPTTNGATSAAGGAVLRMVRRRLGAALRDAELVQVHPTALVDPQDRDSVYKELLAEAVRGADGVALVDEHGRRFADELLPRDQLVRAMRESGSRHFFVLIPDAIAREPLVAQYVERGLVVRAKDSPAAGWDQGPGDGWVAEVTPALHYSMGGLSVDVDGRVLDDHGRVVRGLYAAGEAAGGLHGRNRLAGNSLLECVVFGRIAAHAALEDVGSQGGGDFEPTLCSGSAPPPARPSRRVSADELARHAAPDDLWIAVDGEVLDVTRYVALHPNGPTGLLRYAGKDATEEYVRVHGQANGARFVEQALRDGSVVSVGRLAR